METDSQNADEQINKDKISKNNFATRVDKPKGTKAPKLTEGRDELRKCLASSREVTSQKEARKMNEQVQRDEEEAFFDQFHKYL